MSQRAPTSLAVDIWYHFFTQLMVLVVALGYFLVIDSAEHRSDAASPWPYLVVCVSIAASIVVTFRALEPAKGIGVFPQDFTPKVKAFPFSTLAWDFANLAALTALSGGVHSVFLPLFVIAVVLGDVALEDQRYLLWGTFVVGLVAGTTLPLDDRVRCAYLNLNSAPCADALWRLEGGAEVAAALILFVPGAIFGSLILQRALGKG